MVTPAELLEFARYLASSQGEVAQRAAVSRAYYAAFLHLRQYLIDSNKLTSGRSGQDHARVHRQLRQEDEVAAAWLDFLRKRRNEADYDIEASLHAAITGLAIVAAQSLLEYPRRA